jgi:hypothetical protein
MFTVSQIGSLIVGLVAKVNQMINALGFSSLTAGPVTAPANAYADSRTFYVDGIYAGQEDATHKATPASCMTAIAALTPAASPTQPVKVFSGLKSDFSLPDWSAYNLATLATQGIFVKVFNQ